LFGLDNSDSFYLKYASFILPNRNIVLGKHSTIVHRDTSEASNLTDVTSEADIRAIGYLASAFGKGAGIAPTVEADHKADDHMDISFICVGGVTNHRSRDLACDPANVFLQFQGDNIVVKQTGQILVTAPPLVAGYDYGLIVKIHPTHNPSRTWIWCAGHGDWGTSGAAWFLAHHWKVIHDFAKNRPFARITRTRSGSDDSTRLLKQLQLRGGSVQVLSLE
jgi:hypothetical protein